MKNKNTSSIVDSTGVSEWWFTRNVIAGLFGAVASLALAVAFNHENMNQAVAEQPEPQSAALAAR
jgi:hypothetical protein